MYKHKILMIIFHIILTIVLLSFCFAQEEIDKKDLINEGKNYYKSGKYEEAANAFLEVIKTSVNKDKLYSAYIYLGYTYFTLEEHEKAKIQIDNGIEIKPYSKLGESEFVAEFIDFYETNKRELVGIGFFETIPTEAFVYIDDEKIGLAPIKKELLSRKYFLRLVKRGYDPYETEFEIKSNAVKSIKIDLTKGRNWKTFARSSVVMVALIFLLKSI